MHSRFKAAVALRASSVRFAVPQCFAAPQYFERIVGPRLGLLGFYRGDALIATDVSPGEIDSLAMVVIVVADVIQRHRWDCKRADRGRH